MTAKGGIQRSRLLQWIKITGFVVYLRWPKEVCDCLPGGERFGDQRPFGFSIIEESNLTGSLSAILTVRFTSCGACNVPGVPLRVAMRRRLEDIRTATHWRSLTRETLLPCKLPQACPYVSLRRDDVCSLHPPASRQPLPFPGLRES